jgi:UDP-N-acetyl-D-mannosaminuronic acid dehydrogenase
MVAKGLGVDVRRAIALANHHPRVSILSPGIGVGGHCIPVDPWFIRQVDPGNSSMILAARTVNDGMPARIAARIRQGVQDVRAPRIVVLGATYKPDTADARESPALEIVRLLREEGYDVAHYDPLIEGMGYPSLAAAARDADLLVVLVPHRRVTEELERERGAIERAMRRAAVLAF